MSCRRCIACGASAGTWLARIEGGRRRRPVARRRLEARGFGPPPFVLPMRGRKDLEIVAVEIVSTPAGPRCRRSCENASGPTGASAP